MKVNNNKVNNTNSNQSEKNKKLEKNNKPKQKELTNSVSKVKSAITGETQKADKKTNVNEQELFASMLHMKLKTEKKDGAAKKFMDAFKEHYKNFKEEGSAHALLKAARRAMRNLVRQEKLLTKDESRELRRYAIGMSQLDNNILLQTKADCKSTDNPSMELGAAMDKIKDNKALNAKQHDKFKEATKADIKKAEECPPKEEYKPKEEVKPKEECKPKEEVKPKEECKPKEDDKCIEPEVVKVDMKPTYEMDLEAIENQKPPYILDISDDPDLQCPNLQPAASGS